MEQTRIDVPRAGEQRPLSDARIVSKGLGCASCRDESAFGLAVSRDSRAMTERGVQSILNRRRARDQFFDGDLFADPAWDILLELYAAELGQRRISVSNVCVSASVPATTALRWINHLESKDLVRRKPDPLDGRRVFLSLSGSGIAAMERYFAAVRPRSQAS